MSNAIALERNTVVFTSNEIDLDKVKSLIDKTRTAHPSEESNIDAVAWWFFGAKNVKFYHNNQGANPPIDGIIAKFGEGRSSHTMRDFESTLSIIKPLMLRHKKHTFIVSTEADGFASRHDMAVDFLDAKILN